MYENCVISPHFISETVSDRRMITIADFTKNRMCTIVWPAVHRWPWVTSQGR